MKLIKWMWSMCLVTIDHLPALILASALLPDDADPAPGWVVADNLRDENIRQRTLYCDGLRIVSGQYERWQTDSLTTFYEYTKNDAIITPRCNFWQGAEISRSRDCDPGAGDRINISRPCVAIPRWPGHCDTRTCVQAAWGRSPHRWCWPGSRARAWSRCRAPPGWWWCSPPPAPRAPPGPSPGPGPGMWWRTGAW